MHPQRIPEMKKDYKKIIFWTRENAHVKENKLVSNYYLSTSDGTAIFCCFDIGSFLLLTVKLPGDGSKIPATGWGTELDLCNPI